MTEYKHVHAYNWYHIENKKEVTMGIMGVWYLNWKLFTLEIGAKNFLIIDDVKRPQSYDNFIHPEIKCV